MKATVLDYITMLRPTFDVNNITDINIDIFEEFGDNYPSGCHHFSVLSHNPLRCKNINPNSLLIREVINWWVTGEDGIPCIHFHVKGDTLRTIFSHYAKNPISGKINVYTDDNLIGSVDASTIDDHFIWLYPGNLEALSKDYDDELINKYSSIFNPFKNYMDDVVKLKIEDSNIYVFLYGGDGNE